LVCVIAILQTTLMPHLAINSAKPNLMILLVALWSIAYGSREGSLWALFGGFLLDLLSGAPFGISTASLLAVALVCSRPQLHNVHSRFLLPLLIAGASRIHDLTSLSLLYATGWPISWEDSLLYAVVPGIALNVGAYFLTYPLSRHLFKSSFQTEESSQQAI